MASMSPHTSSNPLLDHQQQQQTRTRTRNGSICRQEDFTSAYEVKELIGQGVTGEVRLCRERATGVEYAVKIVKRSKVDETVWQKFDEEVALLNTLSHPNILELHDVFVSDDVVYIVSELCTGGELFDRILDQGTFTEKDARHIVRRLFDAVSYLHSHGIVHRDLKPENILFKSESDKSDIKIVDFGFATKLISKKRKHMRASTPLGTLGYAAPEVFSGRGYSEKSDVWSLGIMTYILLSGIPPFCDIADDGCPPDSVPFWVYVNKMRVNDDLGPLTFPDKYWKRISPGAKNFVAHILQPDPMQRPRSRDVLKHAWLKTHQHNKSAATMNLSKTVQHLRDFRNTLKRNEFAAIIESPIASGINDDATAAAVLNQLAQLSPAVAAGVKDPEELAKQLANVSMQQEYPETPTSTSEHDSHHSALATKHKHKRSASHDNLGSMNTSASSSSSMIFATPQTQRLKKSQSDNAARVHEYNDDNNEEDEVGDSVSSLRHSASASETTTTKARRAESAVDASTVPAHLRRETNTSSSNRLRELRAQQMEKLVRR